MLNIVFPFIMTIVEKRIKLNERLHERQTCGQG